MDIKSQLEALGFTFLGASTQLASISVCKMPGDDGDFLATARLPSGEIAMGRGETPYEAVDLLARLLWTH